MKCDKPACNPTLGIKGHIISQRGKSIHPICSPCSKPQISRFYEQCNVAVGTASNTGGCRL